jgi:hypothetical protein
VLAVGLVGCPTYEDTYTGTYRETEVDPVTERRAIQIDFFRDGSFARGVLRYYEPDIVTDEPFGRETFCTWTQATQFDVDDRTFELPIERSAQIGSGRLTGEILEGGQMEVTVYDTDTGKELLQTMTLQRVDEQPTANCDMIRDFLIRPTFRLRNDEPNTMPPEVGYEIEHPVFTIQWVGVERQAASQSADPFFVAINAQGWTKRLNSARFDDAKNGLQGGLSLPLPAPPEKIRVPSGTTRYAIGHLVVIDDSTEEGNFRWNVGEEPVIASAMQQGRPQNAPSPAVDGTGKAILFVEGELDELSDSLLSSIEGVERIGTDAYPESHFYIVDVDVSLKNEDIIRMTLPEDPRDRSISVKVTDYYLSRPNRRLPRLFPR